MSRVDDDRDVHDDRGSAPLEMIVLASVTFAFVAAIVFAGRVNIASIHVEGAARAAARQLTLARDPSTALYDARQEAQDAVSLGSPLCRGMTFEEEISESEDSGLRFITVDISCEVDLSEAVLIGVPGTMTVSASATEVCDPVRERSANSCYGSDEGDNGEPPL